MIVKALSALILIFIIWPIALGVCLGFKKNIDRYIIGFCAVQALFFVMYIPAILFAWSSRALAFSATTVITSISIIGVLIRYRNASSLHELLSIGKPNFSYLKNPFFIIAITIVLYEMWTYAVKEPYIYGDDDTYIRLVTNIVDTNTIYLKDWTGQIEPNLLSNYSFKSVFTSYYPFLSSISILSGLHPLILCKTVIPLVYLPIHYLIVLRIGLYLFDSSVDNKTDKLSVFMFFYSILIEWGLISYYTISRRLTIWIYNRNLIAFVYCYYHCFFTHIIYL